jgi:hypothetical protein
VLVDKDAVPVDVAVVFAARSILHVHLELDTLGNFKASSSPTTSTLKSTMSNSKCTCRIDLAAKYHSCLEDGYQLRGFELWRSHPKWYMHRDLIKDCARVGSILRRRQQPHPRAQHPCRLAQSLMRSRCIFAARSILHVHLELDIVLLSVDVVGELEALKFPKESNGLS